MKTQNKLVMHRLSRSKRYSLLQPIIAAVVLVSSVTALPPNAQACSKAAADRHNKAVNEEATAFAKNVRQAVGVSPRELRGANWTNEYCSKLLPAFRMRIPMLEASLPLEDAARASGCGSKENRVLGGKGSARSLIQLIRERISGCEQYIAQQKANDSPQVAQKLPDLHGGQSTSCSDITGTSGPPSTRDCTPRKGAPQIAEKQPEQKSASPRTNSAARDASQQNQLKLVGRPDEDTKAAEARTVTNSSGASNPIKQTAGTPTEPARGNQPGRLWDGRKETCDDASALEMQTSGWYFMCVNSSERKTIHRPSISPEDLFWQAKAQCTDVELDVLRRCIRDAKVRILLDIDTHIRSRCSGKTGYDLVPCVDRHYLMGVAGEDVEQATVDSGAPEIRQPRDPPQSRIACPPAQSMNMPGACCPPGQGIKPTPGAFGAWSCQKLGLPQGGEGQTVRPAVDPGPVEAFEQRVNKVAQYAVASAFANAGKNISADDRQECSEIALAAVRSVLKGGPPGVPEKCRPIVTAARAELAWYADAHIDVQDPALEELLAYHSVRSPRLSPPLPGMQGLSPDPGMTRVGECMLRGGTAENCSAALVPSRPGATISSDCARAESHWKSAEDIKTLTVYQDHLARFPNCEFANLAKARIDAMSK